MRYLLAGLVLFCGLAYGQAFRITSTTPNGQVSGSDLSGALYPSDSVSFLVTAVRENVTQPISAKLFLREYNLQTGALIRELTGGGNETGGAYRLQIGGYRIPAYTCYEACKAGQTLRNSEVKVRIELFATLDYYVMNNGRLEQRTLTSGTVTVPVQYPTVSGISVSQVPLNTFTSTVRLTAKGAKFQAGKYVYARLVKTADQAKSIGMTSPTQPDPYEYWLLPAGSQQYSIVPRIVSEDTIEVSLNTIVGVPVFDSEVPTLNYLGDYDIVVQWQQEAPSGAFRNTLMAYASGLFSITNPLTDDSTKITKLEVEMDPNNPDPAKRTTGVWTPGAANTLEAAPGGFIRVKLTGTHKLSRYAAGLLWLVMRDKATKQSLYMPWDYARNTAGKERDIIEQGYGRHTLLQFYYRLPPVAADLEFFLVLTPQDQETPTNYDKAPTVPFKETFAFSPVVSVAWTKPGDVTIDHIEVVQVVQNDKNEISLIAGKNTVARVFLKVEPKTADPVGNVSVKLTSGNAGTPRRLNGPITAIGEPDRNKFEHSINFALPKEWIQEGELSLDAEIELPKGFTDTKMDNNRKSEKVRFIETPFKDRKFTVGYIPICYQPTPDVERRCPEGDLNTFGSWLQLVYPLAEGRVRYARLGTKRPTARFPLTSVSASKVMVSLNRYFRMYDEKRPGVMDQLVGWLPRITDAPANPLNDRRLPVGRANTLRSGGSGRVAFVQDTSTSELNLKNVNGVKTGVGKDTLYAHMAIAHEVGHNYSLRHPATPDSCGSPEGSPDWPKDAAGNSLPATIGEPGFDTAARKVKPKTLKDLMTYCGPPGANFWASPRHYQKLLTALQGGIPSAAAKQPEHERQSSRKASGGTIALISGSARRDGSAGTLDPIIRLATTAPPDTPDPKGNHCLVFRSDTGTFGQHCFQLNFIDDDPHEESTEEAGLPEEYFSLQVLIPDGTNRVDLMAGSNALVSLKAGSGVPTVAITSPQAGEKWSGGGTRTLSWTASAPDGGALSYAALYSNDGGVTWSPLEVDVTDTKISIDTAELDGGANVFFRVIASSGFDSSETTVGPIELAQAPRIDVPAEAVDFGHVLVGLDSEKTFGLKSTGSGPLTVNGMVVSGAAGFSVVAPEGSFPLAAAETGEITLRFEATKAGVQTGTLAVDSTDPANPVIQVAVRARAVDAYIPEISVAASVDLGTVNTGQSRETPLTIRNVGSALLTVTSVSSNNAAVAVAGSTRFTLEPGAQQIVQLQFRPAAGGAFSSVLTIASDDGDRPSLPVALSGRAVVPSAPSMGVNPAALNFGSVAVGATKELPLTLSNTGNAELSVTTMASNNVRYTVVSPAIPFRLAAGAQQAVTVRFAPTAAQAEPGELTITSNDPARSIATVPITGTGTSGAVSAPSLSVPATVDFGSGTVGQAKDMSVTLRNTGSAALSITAITVSGAQFSIVGAPTLPLTIAANAQQVLNLRMTPVAAGPQAGELRLTSNDPARATVTVALTGTATASAVSNPLPVLDTFVPAAVSAGGGAFALTVTGSRFVSGSTVNWNGTARTTTFVSVTELRAAIAAADIVAPGSIEITVTSPAPGGGKSAGKIFTMDAGGGPVLLAQQFEFASCPLVTAYLSAIDRLGNTITSLGTANFRCTEDGRPVNCSAEPVSTAEIGLSLAVVVDTSVTSTELDTEKSAAASLINLLAVNDRVALIQADAGAVPVGGFTNNRAATSAALTAIGNSGGMGNALFDAIDVAVRAANSQLGRRQAVVVFTGSENTAGTIRDSAVMLARARAGGIPVYVLSFGAAANSAAAAAVMQQLALETAARFAATSGNLLLQAERTGQILANQHAVSWSTPNKDGAFHLYGVTLTSSQGTATTSVFYRGCK
ncbi:MAG: choice-of-anchor D domain-containing protein [Acidobacteria bacterium]|nr:choice-of-anchor D domain-containing protein [Acidobacteriota bacterium]